MKSTKVMLAKTVLLGMLLSTSATGYGQFNLNKLKKKTKNVLSTKEPCANNGSIKIVEGHNAYTMYKNVTKQIEIAEKFVAKGLAKSAAKNIKNAERFLGYLLKKEPNADIGVLCNRISNLKSGSKKSASSNDLFSKTRYFLSRYYSPKGTPSKPERFGFTYGKFVKEVQGFNRDQVLGKAKGSNNRQAKEIENMLLDYSAFLDREGIAEYLMNKLDELNGKSPNELNEMALKIKKVGEGLLKIAGKNEGIQEMIAFAERQMKKSDAAMTDVYTSAFHKENVNKIVFTKKPFQPGDETSVEINPVFKSGDAVVATIYLSTSIKNALNSWKGYGKGGNMGLYVENSNGDYLNMKYEAWEVNSYANSEVSVAENIDKSLTYIQFVLIPNLSSDISLEMKYKNITPILMARGLSLESERKRKITVEVKATGKVTGPMVYKGNFTINLAHGKGASYYADVDKYWINKLLESNLLPTAKLKDSNLEKKLLTEMNRQGFQEQYLKVYIQRGWQLFKPLLKDEYKEMKASFTYKTKEGKCGWQTYSFRSFKTGNGWSSPQKWGGADQRQRLSCNKL